MVYGMFISFTCFLVWVIAVRQLMARPLRCVNFLQIGIYFLSGIVLLLETFRFIESILYNSYNSWFFSLCILSLSLYVLPLIYLNLKISLNRELKIIKNGVFHFIAPVSFSVIIFLFVTEVDSMKKFIKVKEVSGSLLFGMQVITVFVWKVYNIFLLIDLYGNFKKNGCKVSQGLRIFYVISLSSMIVSVYSSVVLLYSKSLPEYTIVFFAIVIHAMYLANYLYPEDAFALKEKHVIPSKISRQLKDVDVDSVICDLYNLFNDEKVFCYEDLNIKGLADELSITHHKLSEIFNKELNKPFVRFVNEYRIREACLYLQNEPDRTILSISHAVGFNSPSSFYSSFKNEIGLTPSEFRLQLIGDLKEE